MGCNLAELLRLEVTVRPVLVENVEQYEEVARAPVENPVKRAAAVTPQLAEAGVDLRGLRKGQRGALSGRPFISSNDFSPT
jgi:hypothetical protein